MTDQLKEREPRMITLELVVSKARAARLEREARRRGLSLGETIMELARELKLPPRGGCSEEEFSDEH